MNCLKRMGKQIGALLLALVFALTLWPVPAEAKESQPTNSITNQMLGSGSYEYGGRIYYGYDDTIWSVKKDGTGKKAVFVMADAKGYNGFLRVAVYEGYVYAIFDFYGGSDACNLQLVRVRTDGSGYENFGNAQNFALADGRIYYTKTQMRTDGEGYSYMDTLGIYVMNVDGTGSAAFIDNPLCQLLAADENGLYYWFDNPKTYLRGLYQCGLDGTDSKELWTGTGPVSVNGSYLYYTEDGYRTKKNGESEWRTEIYRKNRKTGAVKELYSCKGSITNLCVEGKYIYFSSYEKGLVRMSLTGKKAKTLNKHTGAGIRGIHGNVIVFDQHRMDMKNGTDIDIILADLSTGKKIKKLGAFFVS